MLISFSLRERVSTIALVSALNTGRGVLFLTTPIYYTFCHILSTCVIYIHYEYSYELTRRVDVRYIYGIDGQF